MAVRKKLIAKHYQLTPRQVAKIERLSKERGVSASRNGDGGVDVYAHDESNDIIWAIQCKCYSPSRKVGPGIVRELAGSLYRYPDGTQGMIVATSSFTPTAIKEASDLNIELISGDKFAVHIMEEKI